MKITITMPDDIYKKLESDRGLVPRATYIQSLITGENVTENVTEISDVVQGKTPGGLDRCISDNDAVKMVEGGFDTGTRENWASVNKVLKGEGYDWDITTKVLKRGKLLIKRF